MYFAVLSSKDQLSRDTIRMLKSTPKATFTPMSSMCFTRSEYMYEVFMSLFLQTLSSCRSLSSSQRICSLKSSKVTVSTSDTQELTDIFVFLWFMLRSATGKSSLFWLCTPTKLMLLTLRLTSSSAMLSELEPSSLPLLTCLGIIFSGASRRPSGTPVASSSSTDLSFKTGREISVTSEKRRCLELWTWAVSMASDARESVRSF
mmetsp:Transcript_59725/g.142481  ORF Transcript_59725/g.142481 Transcript_59725/m.142481 type:complete len:204 (-) Transcript_59725:390-1001(-)